MCTLRRELTHYAVLCGLICKMRPWSIFWDENPSFIPALSDVFEDKDLPETTKSMKSLAVCSNDIFKYDIFDIPVFKGPYETHCYSRSRRISSCLLIHSPKLTKRYLTKYLEAVKRPPYCVAVPPLIYNRMQKEHWDRGVVPRLLTLILWLTFAITLDHFLHVVSLVKNNVRGRRRDR